MTDKGHLGSAVDMDLGVSGVVDKLELEKYKTFGRLIKQLTLSDNELIYVLAKYKELVELLTHMPAYELAQRAAMQEYLAYESMLDARRTSAYGS